MQQGNTKSIRYNASPTCAQFHASSNFFRGIRGPVGSGKSSACMIELMIRAHQQEPWEGVRRTRWVLIRNTYPELQQSTIKTFQHWFPQAVCPVVFDKPIRARLQRTLKDGTQVDAEFIFLAIDTPEQVGKLLSTEYTGAYINEASEIDQQVLTTLAQRVGRYPAIIEGEDGKIAFKGPSWVGIIADTNPPSTRHWWYRFAEDETPEWKDENNNVQRFDFFVQPPAMLFDEKIDAYIENPDAENIRFLNGGYGYYKRIIASANGDHNTIRRMVCNEYGVPLHGKPVFPNFKTRLHVSKTKLKVDKSLPLILALDWGLTPAALFGQQLPLGGIRLLEEITPTDVSLEDFLDTYVIPTINSNYSKMKIYIVGDPAGRGRSANDKRTPFDILKTRNFHGIPAITNSFIPRKEAVDYFLNRTDGLLISSDLTMVREGFLGQYAYSRLVGSKGQYKPTPDKNDHSHVMDTVQYLCLFARFGSQRLSARRVSRSLNLDLKPDASHKKKIRYA